MDDAFLMGMLHSLTDKEEQPEPSAGWQSHFIAESRDGHAADQLNDKVGTPRRSRAAIEDAGNVRVLHESERLPFGLEPRLIDKMSAPVFPSFFTPLLICDELCVPDNSPMQTAEFSRKRMVPLFP